MSGKLDQETKILTVDGKEIGFVYYRTGYAMEHYMDDEQKEYSQEKIDTRIMMECSMAVKCPSIDFHLTTFKKYQQTFTDE